MEKIDRINETLQIFIDVLLGVASMVMLAVNLAQVLYRYAFHASILWSEELSTYLYVWIIMLSLYAACHDRNELNIGVISFKSEKASAVLNMVREICGLITVVALFIGSCIMIKNAFAFPQKTASLKIITAYLYFCMPISFALLAWLKTVNIAKDVMALKGNKSIEGGNRA